jgi:molecular chaperone DnaK
MTNPKSIVVGIDLGTTNSAIAIVQDGELKIIPVDGRPTMPSAVGIDPAGRLLIGQAAKNQAVSAPENTVLSIKRLMGTDETVLLGGKSYRPEEISALILGELKKAAEIFLGHPVNRAVITVPAFFNERQRQATQDSGQLAGLEVMRIINEPTAAALAYGAGQTEDQKDETLLVYDLGGGTFDVSIVQVENGIVEVKASHGDIHLGGDDFDTLLAGLGEKRLGILPENQEDALGTTARRRLKCVMENAKILLSDEPFARVSEEYLTASRHLETEISRVDYEELIKDPVERTLDCMQRALKDAGVTANRIDKLMLVGGATRTPLVQARLEAALGMEPRHEIDPDLVVAMGAAIQAAALAGQPAPAILIDISAHTYSVLAVSSSDFFEEHICVPIIRRGTALPVSKSEVFTTRMDHQERVEVCVYQGEHQYPDQNLKIGTFFADGLSAVPAGNEIVVRFQIDLSGMLTVTATEKSTGLAKSVGIDTAGRHRINLDAARTNLAALFAEQDPVEDELDEDETFGSDPGDGVTSLEGGIVPDAGDAGSARSVIAAPASLLASAKSLKGRAEKLLESNIPEADAASIRSSLAHIPKAIEDRDWEKLESQLDTLSDLLFYLED